MKIPEKIKVLYKDYTVEETANLHDNGGDLYGQIHYLPEKIFLNVDSTCCRRTIRNFLKSRKAVIQLSPTGGE